MSAPKPAARSGEVSFWRYLRLFRRDLLSAQPERLYRAKMAEFRTPFFRSFLVNEPDLVQRVLRTCPQDFPKSRKVTAGLRPLLGASVFVTNGAAWRRQRRIIDPAFSGGRPVTLFPAILDAANAARDRIRPGVVDVEALTSHATADVIFRALFSTPIDSALAAESFAAFRTFQRAQPVATPGALASWVPLMIPLRARVAARAIRRALAALVDNHIEMAKRGEAAPNDLVRALMTTPDPVGGGVFDRAEVIDQVAIFFLAGHETSASALSWAMWLLADDPARQERVRREARAYLRDPTFSRLSEMTFTRDVLRETLRLYPPVPMMVREARVATVFRNRRVRAGDQVVVSPWHLHRHKDYWSDPDVFCPERWEGAVPSGAYLPFSAGPRICPGAGLAMTEATVMLAVLVDGFQWRTTGPSPVPVAHLTVRARDGIRLVARPGDAESLANVR